MSRLMLDHHEAITRLVHAAGRASVSDLLATYQARPMTAKNLRKLLDELADRGWLVRVRAPSARHSNGVAWVISDDAAPHLLQSQRLPKRPNPVPPLASAAAPASTLPAAAPAAKAREALPVAPAPYRPHFTPWVPPPPTALRPGALDFLNHPSHGACR